MSSGFEDATAAEKMLPAGEIGGRRSLVEHYGEGQGVTMVMIECSRTGV